MAEPMYTVASDSETTGGDKQQCPFPDLAVGIDIGTSKCSVALWNGSSVELLRNTRNQKSMHSYVLFKDVEAPSGGISEELPHSDHEIFSGSAVFNMKRLVGRVDSDPIVHASKTLPFLVQTLDIGARPFVAALVNNVWRSATPEEVLAIFLVELKAMAEIQLKRPIRSAVLTIPVSFSRVQQTRVERACAVAGLHVLRLMPEPASVALLYAQQQQQVRESVGSGIEKVALIFNMGAGYCDVAVTSTAGGVSQMKAQVGAAVGGEDMLQNVLRHLVPDFEKLSSNHNVDSIRSMGVLRIVAQDAIHKLSSQSNVQINAELGGGSRVSRSLDRAEFEQVNSVVFEKCEKLLAQCLADAKLAPEDIDDVILVGGCSQIPKIRDLVLGLCKREDAYEGIDPLEAAVSGAALEGAIASGISVPSGNLDLLTIQATPLSLGVRVDGHGFAAIVHRNTAIPARKDMVFTTAHDSQTEALVMVYEGEGRAAEENHLLGYFKVTGIPPGPKGSAVINVCMDVDASNVLRVFAGVFVPGTRQPVSPFLEVRMPMVDDGHGWCSEALARMYGSTLDLATVSKKMQ